MDSESLADKTALLSKQADPNLSDPIIQQASPIFESEQLRVITASFVFLQFPLNTLRYAQFSGHFPNAELWFAETRDSTCYLLRNTTLQTKSYKRHSQ
jgi:hypothetical protein